MNKAEICSKGRNCLKSCSCYFLIETDYLVKEKNSLSNNPPPPHPQKKVLGRNKPPYPAVEGIVTNTHTVFETWGVGGE